MTQYQNDNFLRACRGKDVDYTPVWFMRQAGRYLQSYRTLREKHDVLTICKTPGLSAKVTVEAAAELGVDAAIIFADIMLPMDGLGVRFKIVDGVGPVIEEPIEDIDRVEQMGKFSAEEHVPYVLDAIRLAKNRLAGRLPLIGFSGAPFTLASYLIEGGPSREFTKTKTTMYDKSEVWNALLSKLSELVTDYLLAQIRAGVGAVQLFDSWSGCLSPSDYEEFVLPFNKSIFDGLGGQSVPRIHFGVGTTGILKLMKKAGGDVFGIDWRIPIDEAWTQLGDVAVQGNLDPATLLGSDRLVESKSKEILGLVSGRAGHVFNLGHGVLPDTDPERVKNLVRFVHETTRRRN